MGAPRPVWRGQARLDEVSVKMAGLVGEYRTGLPGSIVFGMIRQPGDERNNLRTERVSFTRSGARTLVTLTGEWDDLDLYAQREMVRSVIEAGVIKPTGRPGRHDPSRAGVVPVG